MKKLLYLLLVFNLTFVQVLYAQKTIKGTVYDDSDKSPLPGVNVVVDGTSIGVVTNLDGKYELESPTNDGIVEFSFIGMKSQRISFKDKSVIDVYMVEEDNALSEVVVTASGVKREKKALGYGAQEVKGEDAVFVGNPNPISGLQGKVAGLQVVQSSGTPGSSSKIVIRGNSSFANSQPLIVIDGIPLDNSTNTSYSNNTGGVDQSNRGIDINPDDIESVTVLKGAAATAVYGSRAGNGVIVYTTKKGSSGKLSGSFSTDWTFTSPVNLHERQEIYGQSAPGSSLSWGGEVAEKDKVNVMDDFFKTGINRNVNMSVQGGNDKTNMRLSVGYTDADGIIPNSNWKRLSTRLTASSKLTDRLTVEGTANIINSGGNRPQKGSNLAGVMLSLYRNPIDFDPYYAYYEDPETKGTNASYTDWYDNPYYSAHKNTYNEDVWRILANGKATYDLLGSNKLKFTSLNLIYRTGIDSYSDSRKIQSPIGSNTTDSRQGIIGDYTATFHEFNNDLILNGGSVLTDDLTANFLFGFNSRTVKDQYIYNEGTNLSEDGFYNIANSQSVVSEQKTDLENEYSGYYDISFGYKNYLYAGLSGRNEWSSRLHPDKKSQFFPAVNTSFVFSELMELENSSFTFGKIRFSHGKTGIAPALWRYKSYTEAITVGDGFTDGNAQNPNGGYLTNFENVKGNPNLGPEIQIGTEAGIELQFFDGRLTADIGVYQQNISNLLVNVPISSATGFEYQYQNIGEMQNRGIEIALSGDVIKKDYFTWNTSLNFSKNRNEVLSLSEGLNEVALKGGFTSISAYAAIGEQFGVLYASDVMRDNNGNLLVDADGYTMATPNKVMVGDPNPDFIAGFRNTVSYKNFDISLFFDGSFGGDVYNGTKAMMNYRGTGIETADREGTIIVDGVYADGTMIDGVDVSGQANTSEISKEDYWKFVKGIAAGTPSMFIEDTYFIKLRELSLSYTHELKDKKINSLKFGITFTNLLTFTNYSDGDPETSLTGAGSNVSGFDYFNSPNVRGVTFSVGAKF